MDRFPKEHEVELVKLAFSAESIIQDGWGESKAREALSDLTLPFKHVMGVEWCERHLWIEDDEAEESRDIEDAMVFASQVYAEVTVEQWKALASKWLIDLEAGEVLPENVEQTLGIMTAEGVVPAVSIPGMDEGYGYGGYEPALIVSLYVAVLLKEGVEA